MYLDGSEELYDVKVDDGEINNLAFCAEYEVIKEKYKAKLITAMEKTNDNFFSLYNTTLAGERIQK